jgi:hypothetical protein
VVLADNDAGLRPEAARYRCFAVLYFEEAELSEANNDKS